MEKSFTLERAHSSGHCNILLASRSKHFQRCPHNYNWSPARRQFGELIYLLRVISIWTKSHFYLINIIKFIFLIFVIHWYQRKGHNEQCKDNEASFTLTWIKYEEQQCHEVCRHFSVHLNLIYLDFVCFRFCYLLYYASSYGSCLTSVSDIYYLMMRLFFLLIS